MVKKNKGKKQYFKKTEEVDAMKMAKDTLALTAGVVVLGAGAKMIGEL